MSPNPAPDPVQKLKKAFWQEVTETREVAELLRKKSKGVALSEDESQRLGEQLVDLGKLVPLITLLILPFGAFMIVLIERILPFSLLPSAFKDLLPREESPKKDKS